MKNTDCKWVFFGVFFGLSIGMLIAMLIYNEVSLFSTYADPKHDDAKIVRVDAAWGGGSWKGWMYDKWEPEPEPAPPFAPYVETKPTIFTSLIMSPGLEINLETGEVTILDGVTIPEAAKYFWSAVEKAFPEAKEAMRDAN